MHKISLRFIYIMLMTLVVLLSVYRYNNDFDACLTDIENTASPFKITCRIDSYPVHLKNYTKVVGKITKSSPVDLSGKRLVIYIDINEKEKSSYGSIIELEGGLSLASKAYNKSSFDYSKYLKSQNTIGIFYNNSDSKISLIKENPGFINSIYSLRIKVLNNISKYFFGDEKALICAMLTGEREFITDELESSYKKSGIYHIVSVSGLHISIFISIIIYLVSLFPLRKRLKMLITYIASLVLAVVLYIFTGFGISVTRVILMLTFHLVGYTLMRRYNILISIVASAVIILIFSPWELYNISFQLTFLSTFGLCIASQKYNKFYTSFIKPIIDRHSLGAKSIKCFKFVMASLAVSLGAFLATLFISVSNFGGVSIASFISNMLIVPLANILLVVSLIFILISFFAPLFISEVLSAFPYLIAMTINKASHVISNFNYSYVEINLLGLFAIILMASLVISIIQYVNIQRKRVMIFLSSAILVVNLPFLMYNVNMSEITFLNSGKGESVIFHDTNGKTYMFDCGSSRNNSYEDIFLSYLNYKNIRKIDKLFISYYDDEHISAVGDMLKDGYVDELILPEDFEIKSDINSQNRDTLKSNAKKYNTKITYINRGDTLLLSDKTHVTLKKENHHLKDKNACGVYEIKHGEIKVLLSSCLGAKGQEALSATNENYTILKIPSYGQINNHTKNYIKSKNPLYGVVTMPENDRYLKFSDKLKDILKTCKIKYFRTDKNGTVSFYTDGYSITGTEAMKGGLYE